MKIALLGDIAFYGKYSIKENSKIFEYFNEVSLLLKKYDYVIGNLETPFATNEKAYGAKSAYIKSDPENIELLKFLNISYVNLANNHLYDFGKSSYKLTKKLLQENDIKLFGIEHQQEFIVHGSNKLALHGYCCYSTNPLGVTKDNSLGVNELNLPVIEKQMLENEKNGFLNLIAIHCGQEHVNYPNYDHIRLARQLAKVCPYIFYGHHPHVMQGIESIENSLIAYSLGNFCFDDVYTKKSKEPLIVQSINNKTSFILEIDIEDNKIVNYKTIQIFADKDSLKVNYEKDVKLEEYSEKLKIDKSEYINMRNELLSDFLQSRKQLRDFKWYLKRLNFKSFLMIKNAIANKKKYNKSLVAHLKSD